MSKNDVGYRNPPKHSRFKPGISGNPKGRPKREPFAAAVIIDKVLNTQTQYREGGKLKNATFLELAIMAQMNKAAQGNPKAAEMVLILRAHAQKHGDVGVQQFVFTHWMPDRPGQTAEDKTREFAKQIEAPAQVWWQAPGCVRRNFVHMRSSCSMINPPKLWPTNAISPFFNPGSASKRGRILFARSTKGIALPYQSVGAESCSTLQIPSFFMSSTSQSGHTSGGFPPDIQTLALAKKRTPWINTTCLSISESGESRCKSDRESSKILSNITTLVRNFRSTAYHHSTKKTPIEHRWLGDVCPTARFSRSSSIGCSVDCMRAAGKLPLLPVLWRRVRIP